MKESDIVSLELHNFQLMLVDKGIITREELYDFWNRFCNSTGCHKKDKEEKK